MGGVLFVWGAELLGQRYTTNSDQGLFFCAMNSCIYVSMCCLFFASFKFVEMVNVTAFQITSEDISLLHLRRPSVSVLDTPYSKSANLIFQPQCESHRDAQQEQPLLQIAQHVHLSRNELLRRTTE